jgi:hypothetical protein
MFGGTMRNPLFPLALIALIAIATEARAEAFEVGKNRPGDNFNGFVHETADPQMCQDASD